MASVTSSDGYSNDPSTWPEWVVWRGPWPGDIRYRMIGEEVDGDPEAATDHTHARRTWVEENLPRRRRQDRRLDEVIAEEWERRHPGIPYRSRQAAELVPDDYPLDD